MIVVKDKPIAIGRRGNFINISNELSRSRFTGVAEVSYRLDEISKARIVFINGRIVECKISKLISKLEINGDDAINELLMVDKCVVDLYTISESVIDNFGLNEVYLRDVSLHSGVKFNKDTSAELSEERVVETKPVNLVDSVESVGFIEPELDREEILKKYKIKEPSEEEIDEIIKKAVEDEVCEYQGNGEFERIKEELKSITRKHIGKLSKKIESQIDSSTLPEELLGCISEIKRSKYLLMFTPKENLNRMIEEMETVLKINNIEKLNT